MFWFTESYYNLSAKRSAILQGQALFIIVKQKILFHFWASDRQTDRRDRQAKRRTHRQTQQTYTEGQKRKGRHKDRHTDKIERHTDRKDRKLT